ncbi:MAG TPA: hypothetical protein DD417_13705 [Elusimicrobia bacterium]|nr:hypothetical protein [Elusimicrobiota bacterium]
MPRFEPRHDLIIAAIEIPPQDVERIGRRIWQNECGGTVSGLTSWNQGEAFASLGIGHFIWYPAGQEGPFEESFPRLIAYLRANGARLPEWLKDGADCPWPDRQAFLRDLASPRMTGLRALLADTVPLQARFIIDRLEASLPRITATLPAEQRAAVGAEFYRVAAHPVGLYALADYVNFKGEGINPGERYHGQGWGLLQVLQGMSGSGNETGAPALAAYAGSAARVLERRVANSPPERNEARWLPGWLSRVATYRVSGPRV